MCVCVCVFAEVFRLVNTGKNFHDIPMEGDLLSGGDCQRQIPSVNFRPAQDQFVLYTGDGKHNH